MSDRHDEEMIIEETPPLLIDFLKPTIYEGSVAPSNFFDSVTIDLDGRTQADLDWNVSIQLAQNAIDEGKNILWNLTLGLFENLAHPISNHSQFATLSLSIEHFLESVWKNFRSNTLGISIYRGTADFSIRFPWDEIQEENFFSASSCKSKALFCRDVGLEYLELLASRLPDDLPVFLFLDASSISSEEKQLELLNPERLSRFHLFLKGALFPSTGFGWGSPMVRGYSGIDCVNIPEQKEIVVGVSVPLEGPFRCLAEGVKVLKRKEIPFKIIAEMKLTSEWNGLDYLLFSPEGLTREGKRRLLGFAAAGGTLVSTGDLLGLPNEIRLENLE